MLHKNRISLWSWNRRNEMFSQLNTHSEVYSFFKFYFCISWRLITLQYCTGFCHTLKWISHGFTCVPPPDPHSHLPLHPIPLGLPSGPEKIPGWSGEMIVINLIWSQNTVSVILNKVYLLRPRSKYSPFLVFCSTTLHKYLKSSCLFSRRKES